MVYFMNPLFLKNVLKKLFKKHFNYIFQYILLKIISQIIIYKLFSLFLKKIKINKKETFRNVDRKQA
jgi:hypothetical protein